MIDFEAQIVTAVENALTSDYPSISVESVETYSPSVFPFVSVIEIDNSVVKSTQDSTHNENHAAVTYEINVFSNKADGRKAQCKAIASQVDSVMLRLGFTRITSSPVVMDKASIYRRVMRYTAIISTDGVIYRR